MEARDDAISCSSSSLIKVNRWPEPERGCDLWICGSQAGGRVCREQHLPTPRRGRDVGISVQTDWD